MTERERGLNLGEKLERAQRFIFSDLWQVDLGAGGRRTALFRFLQFSVMVARGFVGDRLLLRASALTFMTALSAMPLLVVVVALIGLVGGEQSLINMAVDQLTAVSSEASDWIISRIQEVHIRNLGTLGGATLVLTAVLALRHLESTLGEIWGVKQSRSWPRRFADYLAVLVVAPMLAGVAVSLWASLESEPLTRSIEALPLIGELHGLALRTLPQVLLWAAFGFLYWFFPNTRVNVSSAALGALVAVILFSITRMVYVDLSVGAARYSVLFGGLVALPLVLTWIYVCWSVVLFGAEVAFAHQNLAHYRDELRGQTLAPAERETQGARVILAIARAFNRGNGPQTAEHLALELNLPIRSLRETLDELDAAGLIATSLVDDFEPAYLPSRPPTDTTLADVLLALRGERRPDHGHAARADGPSPAGEDEAALREALAELDRALKQLADSHTLSELAQSPPDSSANRSLSEVSAETVRPDFGKAPSRG